MRKLRFLGNPDSGAVRGKLPLVELVGTNRVLVENHFGVLAYSLSEIVIKVTFGSLSVKGGGLKLQQMNREQLVIVGKIEVIQLNRR